uniref:Uncharacterized protein n=1 Tax=Triticum urartu TaxID=4572 RepID=A0A8R7Q878_TRIUA
VGLRLWRCITLPKPPASSSTSNACNPHFQASLAILLLHSSPSTSLCPPYLDLEVTPDQYLPKHLHTFEGGIYTCTYLRVVSSSMRR